MTPDQIAEQAIMLLDREGWCQGGTGRNDTGERCLGYSLAEVCRSTSVPMQISSHLVTIITDLFPGRVDDISASLFGEFFPVAVIVGFNDHPETTVEDVKVVLKTFGAGQ